MSITAAKAKLNELIDEAARTHEHVTITKNGAPAVVMISADQWESVQETLFWLSQTDVATDIAAADAESATGDTVSGEQLRRQYGLPPAQA
ncbi:type II toxin-antitoxin system Phd/YefM family antitoxin [Blastococcus sp. Marseille-P5729]|uniref:type II toxin-antitoxin system Phd/YefM family antitoxin n=1 Tax=Blastococcus sp. Marseille-P5729 TaxID=2086582 RepID=UPI000D109724|nr:type II toxin-antitoxin system Phd/YefM family antitoxin [Blastococcus sp. Marseille-P5729]